VIFIPLAFGRVFLNCPLPTHLQLAYNRFQGKITRLEVYNSDLLTYSGVQTRPSHVFTFYTHACTKQRSSFPSGGSGGHGPEGSVNERSAVTFVPKGDPFTRRSWSSNSCFRAVIRHLRSAEGDILRHRRSWSLSLRF